MRVAVLLGAALLVAGCTGPGGVLEPVPRDPAPDGSSPAPEEPTFCETEAGCDFWDDDYHEYVLYEVDAHVLDVLLVPSASAGAQEDTATLRAAVEAWAAGIRELGAPWFAEGFAMNVYLLGQDAPPQEALADPEIVVLAAEFNPALLFGIGLEPKQLGCSALGQETLRAYPVHAHHGMEVRAADCTGVGFVCFAANSNFLTGSQGQLHDLVAHEVGHCLGGGHVGDALDFKAKRVPVRDIMSYQHDEEQVHCVSNLNVRVLEALYASLLGQGVETPLAAGGFLTMRPADYRQVACANP